MIQNIKLNKGQIIKTSDIQYSLIKAKSTYDYAKFTLYNGRYITVTFLRDNSFEIATDVREQYQLFYDIKVLKTVKSCWGIIDFLFKWLNRLNK